MHLYLTGVRRNSANASLRRRGSVDSATASRVQHNKGVYLFPTIVTNSAEARATSKSIKRGSSVARDMADGNGADPTQSKPLEVVLFPFPIISLTNEQGNTEAARVNLLA